MKKLLLCFLLTGFSPGDEHSNILEQLKIGSSNQIEAYAEQFK